MKPTQVSLIQMDIEFGEKKANHKKGNLLIEKAFSQALPELPHIICLPELFSTGYDLDNVQKHAEQIPDGRTTSFLQQMAKEFSAVIVASFIEVERKNYYNTAVVIDDTGFFLGKYRKIHLFPPMNEPEIFSIGGFLQEKLSFKTKSGNLGLLICYDLRFPELSRRVTLNGNADILAYLAEFPHPKYEVWTRLLQARAIENQLFVCGVNRVGSDRNFQYFGHSVIYDPSGNILIEGTDQEEVLTAQLDPSVLNKVRSVLPSLEHRRPDHY
ncbi:MAG: carbon-nitrogen family hydrolase [Candidatus Heimdallarchaeota archaeon]|nr:MAG: carbon-nitrogen family hydrolase [Candidatus Heimdallarchaeota archaeon]